MFRRRYILWNHCTSSAGEEALEFSYDIVWEKGFAGIAPCIRQLSLAARKACVVTDSQVGELYLPEIIEHLSGCFFADRQFCLSGRRGK